MLQDVILLAADADAYNKGLQGFQLGVSGAGVAILIGGVSLLFSKQKLLGVIVCLVGLAIVAYPWVAFEPM
jgi:hypothetical protein